MCGGHSVISKVHESGRILWVLFLEASVKESQHRLALCYNIFHCH